MKNTIKSATIHLNSAQLDTANIEANGTYGFMIPIEFTDIQHKELVSSIAKSICKREGWTCLDESQTITFISMDFYDEGAIGRNGRDLSVSYKLYVETAPVDESELIASDTCLFTPIKLTTSECNQLKQIMVMRFEKMLASC